MIVFPLWFLLQGVPTAAEVVSIAKKHKLYTAIDNTWGTPYYLKPIKLGFDMSIVSATKYYSGHSDVMGGSLAVNKRVFSKVKAAEKITGLRLGPDDAYLITRGLRTLDVRLDRHRENAKKVAAFLSNLNPCFSKEDIVLMFSLSSLLF